MTDKIRATLLSRYGGMLQRCYNSSRMNYHYYGGRGITVCDRWRGLGGAQRFIQDMGHEYFEGSFLDRKNSDGPYSPENCRWSTRSSQMRNTRRNSEKFEVDGKMCTLSELKDEFGVNQGLIKLRISRGWSLEKAVKTPVRKIGSYCPTSITHGMSREPIYTQYIGMLVRCRKTKKTRHLNPPKPYYEVCDEWTGSNGFVNFYADMGAVYRKGLSLDRVDNKKGYFKENCRWASPTVQTGNRECSIKLTAFGKEWSLMEISVHYGVPYYRVLHRVRSGWTAEDAVLTPPYKNPTQSCPSENQLAH